MLSFTYHHSDEESWGELLESLCDTGFETTATYPINSDLNKFQVAREAVSFDIVIVARPTDDRKPISWNSLRRRIVCTAKETRQTLEENRELKGGDIGVIEMGKCFQEYSKHHGAVRRGNDAMTAKEVVGEFYGIIQDNTRGEQAIYLDLLEERAPGYDDLNKHLRHSDASEDQLKEMRLVETAGGSFALLDWRDEGRQVYVQTKVGEGNATPLDKAHFLRYRFEEGKTVSEYVDRRGDEVIRQRLRDVDPRAGDVLLVQTSADVLDRLRSDTNIVVSSDEQWEEFDRTQIPIALGIVAGVVGLAALDYLSIMVSALAGVVAMLFSGVLRPTDAYEAVDWNVIFLLAGVIPLGIAFEVSGTADLIATGIVAGSAVLPPIAMLAAFYLGIAIITEMVSIDILLGVHAEESRAVRVSGSQP